ncbi:MAG: hypothetical protein IKU60_04885 [Clostridia bacterium]|nr:hypothetical protein [Clostridia bacterium]
MKKLSKILLVMALTLTVFFAMMAVASAATIKSVEAGVAADAGRTISVTVEYGSPEAAQQSTVLVVKSGTALATLQDSDIKYIDQEAVTDTAVTYTFKLLEADRTGAYDVYVGGTGVDAPEDTSFSFDTKKIIGTITVLGDATKATAVATDASAISVNGTVKADGTYAIEVGQGTYTVVLGKAGYLYKTYENVAANAAEVNLGEITLIGGDFSGDGVIDIDDLNGVLMNYKGKVAEFDMNDDDVVDIDELNAVLGNYKAEAAKAYN